MKLQYAFKTPTLRDVARRGPYMHDGSLSTLQDVIDLYNRGGIDRPSRDEEIHQLNLPQAKRPISIAFLQTLNGKPRPFAVPDAAALTPGVADESIQIIAGSAQPTAPKPTSQQKAGRRSRATST